VLEMGLFGGVWWCLEVLVFGMAGETLSIEHYMSAQINWTGLLAENTMEMSTQSC